MRATLIAAVLAALASGTGAYGALLIDDNAEARGDFLRERGDGGRRDIRRAALGEESRSLRG